MTMKTMTTGLIGLLLLAGATGSAGAAPSFSCTYIARPAERAICSSTYLSYLDRRLEHWYAKARERAAYFDQTGWLKRSQRDWLAARNSCGYDKACLAEKYHERIAWLRDYYEHV
jgi:uncharacterized protein